MFFSYTETINKGLKSLSGLIVTDSKTCYCCTVVAVQLVGGEVYNPVMMLPWWWGIYHRVIKIVSVHDAK